MHMYVCANLLDLCECVCVRVRVVVFDTCRFYHSAWGWARRKGDHRPCKPYKPNSDRLGGNLGAPALEPGAILKGLMPWLKGAREGASRLGFSVFWVFKVGNFAKSRPKALRKR